VSAAPLPWTITDAREALARSSAAQSAAEQGLRKAVQDYAHAEENYRRALATRIAQLRGEGAAATVAADLARGDEHVAQLRRVRDIAEGVKEAMAQVGWRASADRRDTQALAEWSMRRELAETGHRPLEAVA
jgi:hypothetical protein